MDTSEQYIKMCIAAFGDLGGTPVNGCPNLFIQKDRAKWPGDGLLLSDKPNDQTEGQKYRQDQLQGMIKEPDDFIGCWPLILNTRLAEWSTGRGIVFWGCSYEMLWLIFIMHELHNKEWTGEDWK